MFSVLNSSNTKFNHSSSVNSEHIALTLRGRHKHEESACVARLMDIYEEGSAHRFDQKRITLNVGGVKHGECSLAFFLLSWFNRFSKFIYTYFY